MFINIFEKGNAVVLLVLYLVGVSLAENVPNGPPKVDNFFSDPAHLVLIAIGAALALILGGRGIADLIKAFRKTQDVTVNVDPSKRCPVIESGGLAINPELCVAHQAEHERSIRNHDNIEKLFNKVEELGKKFDNGFNQISKEIGDTKGEILGSIRRKVRE